jgi:hypothetical protein
MKLSKALRSEGLNILYFRSVGLVHYVSTTNL